MIDLDIAKTPCSLMALDTVLNSVGVEYTELSGHELCIDVPEEGMTIITLVGIEEIKKLVHDEYVRTLAAFYCGG